MPNTVQEHENEKHWDEKEGRNGGNGVGKHGTMNGFRLIDWFWLEITLQKMFD